MTNFETEVAIVAGQAENCEHTFSGGVCTKCFCPESPEFFNKALLLMETKNLEA